MRRRDSKWLGPLAVVLLCACHPSDQPALRVGSNTWPGYEPLYIAQELGHYPTQELKVINFPSAVEVMRAYRNGVLDIAALTVDEALTIAVDDPDRHVIFLVADYSAGADVIVARPPIQSMAELRGRRIGAEGNALGALMLTRALALSGLTLADIEFVPLGLQQHEMAYEQGWVDAVVTFEPRRTRLLAAGAREVFSSKQIPGEVIDVLMARKSVLRARRATVERLVRGWFVAVAALGAERRDVIERAARRIGLTAEQYRAALNGVHLIDWAENHRLLVGRALVPQLHSVADLMVRHALLARVPAVESLLEASFLVDGVADG